MSQFQFFKFLIFLISSLPTQSSKFIIFPWIIPSPILPLLFRASSSFHFILTFLLFSVVIFTFQPTKPFSSFLSFSFPKLKFFNLFIFLLTYSFILVSRLMGSKYLRVFPQWHFFLLFLEAIENQQHPLFFLFPLLFPLFSSSYFIPPIWFRWDEEGRSWWQIHCLQ